MNIDPLRLYSYLELIRGRVTAQVRDLTDDDYRREFTIGPGSLAKTLTHIMVSEWYYVERMLGHDVPPYEQWPIKEESPPPSLELERLWKQQATMTRVAITSVPDWNARLTYAVTDDAGKRIRVTATPADQFIQLVQHEVHHRAQAANMLRQLGRPSLGDLDFNSVMFERVEIAPTP